MLVKRNLLNAKYVHILSCNLVFVNFVIVDYELGAEEHNFLVQRTEWKVLVKQHTSGSSELRLQDLLIVLEQMPNLIESDPELHDRLRPWNLSTYEAQTNLLCWVGLKNSRHKYTPLLIFFFVYNTQQSIQLLICNIRSVIYICWLAFKIEIFPLLKLELRIVISPDSLPKDQIDHVQPGHKFIHISKIFFAKGLAVWKLIYDVVVEKSICWKYPEAKSRQPFPTLNLFLVVFEKWLVNRVFQIFN